MKLNQKELIVKKKRKLETQVRHLQKVLEEIDKEIQAAKEEEEIIKK